MCAKLQYIHMDHSSKKKKQKQRNPSSFGTRIICSLENQMKKI